MSEEDDKAYATLAATLRNAKQSLTTHYIVLGICLAGVALNLGVMVWIEFRWITLGITLGLLPAIAWNFHRMRQLRRALLNNGCLCPRCGAIAELEGNHLLTRHKLDCQWMRDPDSEPY